MNIAMLAGALRRQILALGGASLGLMLAAAIAHAAPPAGTPIGNQATATYLDATSNSYTVNSNPVVTVVQQVASFTLTAPGSRLAAPGAQAVLPHVIQNTGNGTDSLSLSLVNLAGDDFDLTGLAIYADANGNGVPDNFTPLTNTGPIAAGGFFRFVIAGSVPGTQLSGDVSRVRISAVSTFDAGQSAFNDDVVTVTGNAVLNVTKAISASNGPSPSGPYTYTLTYTNAGNATATNVRFTDVIPAGMTYVAGSARWSGFAGALSDADSADVQGAGLNTVRFDHNVATPGAATAILGSIAPGASGTVTFQVNVNPNLASQVINNSARFAYFDGAANAGPFYTNVAPFTVDLSVAFTFTGQTVASALQGSTVTFANHLVNTGNDFDTFDVTYAMGSFPAGSTPTLYQSNGIALMTDTNGNGIPDTGPIAPGGSYDVILRVQLPSGVSGGPYTLTKTATSFANPAVSHTATDVLTTVVGNTVDLTNNSALPGAPGAGAGPEALFVIRNTTNPNATTRFTLVVNNTSAQADQFDLAASTNSTFASLVLPAGWTVTFRNGANNVITSTSSIAANSSETVYADVDVPAGFAAGDIELYFRARSATSGASDAIHDQVRVNAVRSLALVPNNSAQVIPGGFIVYTHTLANTGNVTEGAAGSNVALARADDQAGWSSAIYWDTNNSGGFDPADQPIADLSSIGGLAAGTSVRLFVQVFAPSGAPLGQLNTTTVTATTTNLTYVSAVPAVVSALDATQIINGQVTITKYQSLDVDCSGSADSTFTTLNLAYGAVPGACIRYRIVVTNVGTQNVTGVVVNDATPANTVSWNAATATTSVGTLSVPADGASGGVTATVGVLGPGQSAVIEFSVRINFP
ncbi:MAG: DUF11 domain-containing protein [Candidatus Eisenbacteria bacterium]|uniref:DUF11 domain-containing protein n=1 Tax=Eiseniibacteriota bacterium TaxID=2212470 RepID=A0A933SCR4_UNCEI|nr:DUF11 domain-containing protein [Candidatus Eisenbacteria bacterium]